MDYLNIDYILGYRTFSFKFNEGERETNVITGDAIKTLKCRSLRDGG